MERFSAEVKESASSRQKGATASTTVMTGLMKRIVVSLNTPY
jgi:hypothetical protein